ncbi:MAG: glycosyltransferase family 4 protein [Bacteroidota bacterium]|nr:glycosyltransferase family 4 protein [Bacteroidota bacterium]
MNVLISAYAVCPGKGSEPGVGWNWAIQIAKYHKVFVITEAEFEPEIQKALTTLPQKNNLRFYHIDIGEKARKMCWNQGDWRFYYYYHLWQKKALIKAREICQTEPIDILHHLNMIGYREPGLLWKIRDIPFVWGPVGGFGTISSSFLSIYKPREAAKQLIKNIINKIQIFQPNVWNAIKKANLILAANSIAKRNLQRFRRDEVRLLNETNTFPNFISNRSDKHTEDILKILWIGRNIPNKALTIALEVMPCLKDLKIRLDIVGIDSKDINFKKKKELKNVFFHSWMPHNDVQQLLSDSHLLLFTSLFEGTPHVVLEALSNGVPILCHDIYGQGDVINDSCGIKIPFENPKASIRGFTESILKLYNDRELLKKLSFGATKRAREITWETKAEQLISLYNQLTENTFKPN